LSLLLGTLGLPLLLCSVSLLLPLPAAACRPLLLLLLLPAVPREDPVVAL
jgi:hypothetical protein